jgi:tetratricopeptide (TPR) repeat protein
MSEKDWWSSYGPFKRWDECPTRPDPGEVLLFYLEKRGIEPDEHVAYLMDLLDLQKSMIYNILKGEGFDAISRCRQFVQALKIPPPLLGIDARYYPIERHAYWWQTYGFSFNADAQGYPLLSEVVACLRMQRTQVEGGGRVKVWSQEDLGDATGLKKETVYRMEHDKNPLILESMSRRAAVASALGTLAGANEPTIFRLFGLDPQAYGVPVAASESVPEVHFLPRKLTDETLQDYHQQQATFFADYYTRHAQNVVEEAVDWLRRLPTLMPLASGTAQRVNILALQCRYHDLTVGIAREQRKRDVITFHADRAVALAEQSMTLPDPKLGSDHALLVVTHELLASALMWRAIAYHELGWHEQAQTDIDRALNLLPALQSSQLKVLLMADAGLIHAHTAMSETDRTLVSSYFGLAAQINTPSQFQPRSKAPDDNFHRCGTGMLSLRRAMALSAPNMKGATAEKVTDILETAQKFADPALVRRQVIVEVFQAQAYFAAGDYQQATEVALSALEKSQQIRSRLNRDRIEGLYQQLLSTSFRDKPLLAYLGMKLRTWDHGLG